MPLHTPPSANGSIQKFGRAELAADMSWRHARTQHRDSAAGLKVLQAEKELLFAAQVKQVQAHAAELLLLRTELDTVRAHHDAPLNPLERQRA